MIWRVILFWLLGGSLAWADLPRASVFVPFPSRDFNFFQRPARGTKWLTNVDPLGYTSSFVYDAQNGLSKAIDPLGRATTFGYNTNFSLTALTNAAGDWRVFTYDPWGGLTTNTDAGGAVVYYYDSLGQVNERQFPGSLGYELFAYDTMHDLEWHAPPIGLNTETYTYNQRRQLTNTTAVSNLVTTLTYDAVGNPQSGTDARGNTTSATWSATRQPTGTTFPATPLGAGVVSNVYDARDGLLSTLDEAANPTYFSHNPAQETIATADPLLRTNTFKYDADGRLTNAADAASETTVQTYNARGELTRVVDAAGGIIGKTYDAAGNLIYLTNRNTNVWQFQYDAANRVTNTISPTGKTTADTYTNWGLLATVKDAMTQTTTLTYDGKGRLTQRADPVGTIGYQYDWDDDVTAVTNAGSGKALTWGYDVYDRPIACTNAAGYVIKYGYDANGNLTNLVYPGNLPVSYMYDSLNRVTNVTDWAGRIVTNVYDLDGNLTTVGRPDGTERTVAPNADGEPVTITERYTAGAMAVDYEFLSWSNTGRLQWEFEAPLPHAYTPPSRTMTYDSDNRLATFNGNSVTMDNDGNMTYGPGTNNTFLTYSYNARNQLTGAGGITYGYDPAGNRTLMTNGSVITTNVIDPVTSQLLMRIKSGTTNYYIYGAGLLYEIDVTATTTNTLFYHYDSRGSTIALTDGSGNITDRMEYGVYGIVTYRSGTSDTPFLYNGRYGVQTDPNGLLYMRARYYNPYICRFINADPSGFAGGLNQYEYGDGDPVSEMDPFGLGAWYEQAASWVNQEIGTAESYYDNHLPWGVAGLVDFGMSLLGGVANTPQAVGEYGTGAGTFSADPSWGNAPGLASDVSFTVGVASGVGAWRAAASPAGILQRGGKAGALGPGAGRGGWLARNLSGSAAKEDVVAQEEQQQMASTANRSKGTTLPRNLREQLAIEQATANPAAGTRIPIDMTDPRWPGSQGWVKMEQVIDPGGAPINVHYLRNTVSGQVADFKIVLPGAR